MATFKEALTTSLTNFAKSIAKTYPKTANIVDNLLSTDSTLPLSAKQGNVLQTEIDTLNSNLSRCPVNKYVISHNIAITGEQTSTVTLEDGAYIIIQTHPTATASLYLATCMNGYVGKVIAIIEDVNCTISINASDVLSITTKSGGGNFRWWHIIKLSGLNYLEL